MELEHFGKLWNGGKGKEQSGRPIQNNGSKICISNSFTINVAINVKVSFIAEVLVLTKTHIIK